MENKGTNNLIGGGRFSESPFQLNGRPISVGGHDEKDHSTLPNWARGNPTWDHRESDDNIGTRVKATFFSVDADGNPMVSFVGKDGQTYYAKIVETTNQRIQISSNEARQALYTRHLNGEKSQATIQIFNKGRNYVAFCLPEDRSDISDRINLDPKKAHSVVFSEHSNMSYAVCFKRGIEKVPNTFWDRAEKKTVYEEKETTRVIAVNNLGEELKGILKPVEQIGHFRESRAEAQVANDFFNGSAKFGFPGIQRKDTLIARIVGKYNSTYFFNPAIGLYLSDYAVDIDAGGKYMVTGVVDTAGSIKTRDYQRGDLVQYVPILTTMETKSFGVVGIGYILRPGEDYEVQKKTDPRKFLFPLKQIWVQGGVEFKGEIAKKSEIIFSNLQNIVTRM